MGVDDSPVVRRGDASLAQVMANGGEASAIDLLSACFAGYPVERLNKLLMSTEEGHVRIGAWIASELGAQAEPLLDQLTLLLNHSSRYVRFFALDGILMGAGPEHSYPLATAIELIRDSDTAVRWKAMNFIARATVKQLASSLERVQDRQVAELLRWLLRVVADDGRAEVVAYIAATDRLSRLFGAIAAARLAIEYPAGLDLAVTSEDLEVSAFAKEQIEAARVVRSQRRGNVQH